MHATNPDAVVIAESALNDPQVIRPAAMGGLGHDAQWADDFHHAVRTLLTGDLEGYYGEYGRVEQLAKAFHRPFVWDGTYSPHRRRRFGAKADDRPQEQFVVFTQNHDQVGNRAFGDRLPDAARSVGKAMAEFRRVSTGFQAELRDALNEPIDTTPPRTPPADAGSNRGRAP